MTKLWKIVLLISLGLLSGLLTIKISYFLAETYFFDKFYYYKSIEHGYWIPGQKLTLENFGERALDLIQLDKNFQATKNGERILEINEDEAYTIALIGDSYAWGQGVRFKDTISQLLEKKLNQYKKTTVLSLGYSGDSILDYFIKYDQLKQTYPIDLYIFMLVENDLLLVKDYEKRYEQTSIFHDCQSLFPEQKPIYDLSNNDYELRIFNGSDILEKEWAERFEQSWYSELNLCILDQSLQALPTDNAIFFISLYRDEENSQPQWKTYREYLNKNQKTVLRSADAKTLDDYKRFWKKPSKYFSVSPKDSGHPSKTAHRMFADLLGREILTNLKWGF